MDREGDRIAKAIEKVTTNLMDCASNHMALIHPDAMIPPPWTGEGLAIQTKYELDAFQKHAVLGIHAGAHVFVTAKTGSGKTFVGEYLIAKIIKEGGRVFYTTPIKSLSNQKYHDLKKLFPETTVGILTGDIKMCPDAQIVVLTAEILRNLLFKKGTATEGIGLTAAVSLEGVKGIVMDEAHYIQDPDRGHVWEETLILCAKEPIQLVLLSATMPSAASLGTWLAELLKRDVWLLETTFRVVPLVHGVLDHTSKESLVVKPVLDPKGYWTGAYTDWLKGRKAVDDAAADHKKAVEVRRAGGYAAPPPSSKVKTESATARLLRTVSWLQDTKQLPALFFIFSRKGCERYAKLMTGTYLDTSDTAAANHIIHFHLSRHKAVLEKSPQFHAIKDLLLRGIAFHHSGLQPLLKEIVEILFVRGYVKLLFATETFSVGLNMPTKTVVFLELEKMSEDGLRLVRPDEYIQMAGRAGRRGLDTQGLVLYEPMRDPIESSELKGLLTGSLKPLSSQMRFHYDFILKATDLASSSYWAQQQKELRHSLGKDLERLTLVLSTAESRLSAEEKEALEMKAALEARVAESVNAKRKKADAELRKWISDTPQRLVSPENAKIYAELSSLRREHRELTASIEQWDASPLLNLAPLQACLDEWDFDRAAATEINEGHKILGPILAESKRLDALTPEEAVCILAAFMSEGAESTELTLEDSKLSKEALDILYWLDDTRKACQACEDRHRVHSPAKFWTLSTLWPCVASRWLAGYGLTEIAVEFGIFEGNVQRGLMRLSNILDEWKAVAEIRRDLATLERFGSLQILRDELITDSLYLRM
jgi:superfamily II RNA helicase